VGERADGGRTDITVDGRWRQIRVQLTAAGWLVRGGAAGREVLWRRSAAEAGSQAGAQAGSQMGSAASAEEHAAPAAGFLGDSPGFLVAVARSLRLDPGERADVALVRLHGPALAALTVRLRWRLTDITSHETELAPLPVERYEITDLATGEPSELHLAGDVVLAAAGIELAALESPPTLPGRS
jgi:hypothetical protein